MMSSAAVAAEPGIWEREKLTGDWGGARTALEAKGVEVGIAYIGETLSIASGGLRRGTTYEGRLDVTVNTDLEKLMGWTGAKTHARVFQIHNVNNRNAADYVGSYADPSNIDALRTTRLFTAWFEQSFGAIASVRIGQLAADDEFLVSNTAGGLINGTFGWATIMSGNLPSGGAAYPLATPGARLQVNANANVSFLLGVFSGDPAGRGCYDNDPDANPQACNKHGTTFSFSGGTFWIGEAQYNVNQEKDAKGLAASYKVGVWHHTGRFADQFTGVDHSGNWGIYGVIDQMLYRGPQTSVSAFMRGGLVPSDRNEIAWYIDGGIGVKGLLPGRADDTLTFGVAHSHVSDDAVALDYANLEPFIRSGETVFELSYLYQVAPWWSIQPDVQYIVRPSGNIADPADTTRRIGNAFVIGARTTITF